MSNHLLKQFSQVTTPKSFMTGDMPTDFFKGQMENCVNKGVQIVQSSGEKEK